MLSKYSDSGTLDDLASDGFALRYKMRISHLEPMKHAAAKGQSGIRHKQPAFELSYGLILGECILSLQNNLPSECRAHGIKVREVRVTRIQSGSIELWFEVICEGLIYIGGVYAGCELIAKIASRIVRACVKRTFQGECKVRTTLIEGSDFRSQANDDLEVDKTLVNQVQDSANSRNLVRTPSEKFDIFSFILGSINTLLFLTVLLVLVETLLHAGVIG